MKAGELLVPTDLHTTVLLYRPIVGIPHGLKGLLEVLSA